MKLHSVALRASSMSFASGGAPVDDAKCTELLSAARRDEPVELTVTAEVFHQDDAPIPLPVEQREKANANFLRFSPEQLDALAESFVGCPFLRDHERNDVRAVAGEILSSTAVRVDGGVKFVQELRVAAGWAVTGFLNGTIRNFSISADPAAGGYEGALEAHRCSVCAASFLDCTHFPGDVVERDDGNVIAEVLLRDVVGAEVSGVAFPAVSGTEITDIRSELSQARANLKPKVEHMNKDIRVALELSDSAEDRDAIEAIGGLKAHNKKISAELAEAKVVIAGSEEALKAARDELASRDAAAKDAEDALKLSQVDALVERGYSEGRLIPKRDDAGEQVQSKVELAVRRMAEGDLAAGTEYLESMPRLTPVGAPAVDTGEAKGPPVNEYKLSVLEQQYCDEAGLSHKEWREANPVGEPIPVDNGSED